LVFKPLDLKYQDSKILLDKAFLFSWYSVFKNINYQVEYQEILGMSIDFVRLCQMNDTLKKQIPQGFLDFAGLHKMVN
jgi:hypothetical protein